MSSNNNVPKATVVPFDIVDSTEDPDNLSYRGNPMLVNCDTDTVYMHLQSSDYGEKMKTAGPGWIEERRINLQGQIKSMELENRIIRENYALDTNKDKLFDAPRDDSRIKDQIQSQRDLFIEMGKRHTPNEVPELNPGFDREGPTSLDNVDPETTKYAIEKNPQIGKEYEFETESYTIPEYKSIYED